jgi:hypothetical protein
MGLIIANHFGSNRYIILFVEDEKWPKSGFGHITLFVTSLHCVGNEG